MDDTEGTIAELGHEPPLIADGRSRPPDRREISARWLSGTFLTGVTSSILMGVALFAALDGREQLATPPEIADIAAVGLANEGAIAKAARIAPPRQIAKARDRRRFEVSTVSRVGDRDVIRMTPFINVSMALAAGHTTSKSYPPFDPLDVFSEDGVEAANPPSLTGQIYGEKVESEVSLKSVAFPIATASFDQSNILSTADVEKVVRSTSAELSDGAVQVASLHYVDPERFGDSLAAQALTASLGVRIVEENVSVAPRELVDDDAMSYAEDIIPFMTERDVAEAFAESGYDGDDAVRMSQAIAKLMHADRLKAGTVLRVGLEVRGDRAEIRRASVYDRARHLVTIAVDDKSQLVPAAEPEPSPDVAAAFDDRLPVTVRGNLPSVYDGIYRAAYSYGVSKDMTRRLVRLLASDVDFQSRLNPADRIEVLFSQPDEDDRVTEDSELLYVSATLGGNTRTLYRFQMEDGAIDYFDKDGRSAKQFLLRNPVPNGQFSSGFGARRHPILGYSRMHTGTDWRARSGTPIIASGNGVVEKAGWASGYGKQIMIRHANGYQTSYNHQSAFAKGIKPGVRVRQGQVIGYVGSTGLSTGAHLHYELIVNGNKVDPMRVRLPTGKVLKAVELEAFQLERNRIDALLKEQERNALTIASVKVSG
ncbi:M23 family metallopeptidase [Arvimicrobium flavum]|uniref:M23 family metallopeptidase n=1 Tax=Arvimicrobium flavum TaxID=3393320 RepID=UPI00237AA1C7|nr:M23 family metallopeptidase [Mesorhizobium shangrilense]